MNGFFHFPKGPKQAIAAHKKGRLKSTAIRVKLVKEKGRSQKRGKRTEGPAGSSPFFQKKEDGRPTGYKKEPKNGMRKGQRIAVRGDKKCRKEHDKDPFKDCGSALPFSRANW
mgnify:CR=1 FL=1